MDIRVPNNFRAAFQPCTIAFATNATHSHLGVIMLDADYCVEKAEQCFRLARLAKSPDVALAEIATNLEAIGDELMAKAVEIETVHQRGRRKH
jgi:hypothetical protein